MKIDNGWIVGVTHCFSTFYDDRPDNEIPTLLVIHNISLPPESFGGPYIDQLFTGTLNPEEHPCFASIYQLKVSCHCLIRRDGQLIQYVAFDKRAWHAGVSSFASKESCNDFSIGIELEGSDNQPFTTSQYNKLFQVTQLLINYYSIEPDCITGHSDIAPNRKTDPGPYFDWHKYRLTIKQANLELKSK